MHAPYRLVSPRFWEEYELIDCGNFEKLERFGEFILWRPEPQALWDKKLSDREWDGLWSARYVRQKGRAEPLLVSEKGSWSKKPAMKNRWLIRYKSPQLDLRFNLSLTAFGHIGIFPEQAENWEFIFASVKSLSVQKPKVLNLFAYTGASSLAACAAGAEVVHLDSVKQVLTWANDNKQSSKLEGAIRWLAEDAMRFVRREERRGSKYHGIILDPPAYGRGPAGEKWLLDQNLNGLLHICRNLLQAERHFLLLNIYSVGFSAVVLDTLVRTHFGDVVSEIGELVIPSKTGQLLPLGTFVRCRK